MPRTWLVDAAPRNHVLPASAVAMLLRAADDATPAARLLDFLNEVVTVDFLSLVSHRSAAESSGPRLVEGHGQAGSNAPRRADRPDASRGAGRAAGRDDGRDVTAECFAIYRQRYWQSDAATRIAEHLQAEPGGAPAVTVLHWLPNDIPVSAWRSEIYDREHLAGRLSFLYTPQPGQAYSINLYRREPLGAFRSGEVDRLLAVAPLLRQVHRQVLARPVPTASLPIPIDRTILDAERVLARMQLKLSPRELQVCARIASGVTADGIAADLGIAPSTVATLRKRAYGKLGDAGIIGGRWRLSQLPGL